MLAQTFGRLRSEADGGRAVRFERLYDYRPDELWAALTEPEQLRGWLGEADVDLRVGGEVVLRMGGENGGTANLRVRDLDPGRMVEYDWSWSGEDTSILRFELEPRGNGTLLVLDHRRLAAEDAPEYGAGWHSHLDGLALQLEGCAHEWVDRYRVLLPEYLEQAETQSA